MPYREAAQVDYGNPPSCDHMLSEESKQALCAVGGWYHSDECVAWWLALQQRAPSDPRLVAFLRTCNKTLRARFNQ